MRLIFAKSAAADLSLIADFIAVDSQGGAQKVYWAIVRCAEGLTDFPNLGRAGRLPATRELTVPSLPYVIVYQAAAEAITVIAVFHAARDLNQALSDRKGDPKA